MSYLSSENIISLVSEYLRENIYHYAIMIDGSWGSGKTYFAKEIMIPALDVKKHAIYISLYGASKPNEISNLIFTAIAEERAGKGKKLLPLANSGFRILAEVIGDKLGSEEVGGTSLEKIFSPFIDYKDYYFIFDDLERCSMPINEAMGYINHFVEQNESKVIIIANQKEIGSVNRQSNLEFKYYLASTSPISWPEKKEETHYFNSTYNNAKNATTVDLPELKRRCEYLFNEDTLYLQIKEKLVGKTVYYQPDMSNVVPLVFAKCLSTDVILKVKPCISVVRDVLIDEKHYNIRTLQFALIFYSKVASLEVFNENGFQMLEQTLQDVLIAIVKVSVSYKTGNPPHSWSGNSEYGLINLNGNNFDSCSYFMSFRFIHDYIYYSYYDSEHICKTLNDYMQVKDSEKRAFDDPTNKLNYYWEMDDDVIEIEIRKMYNNLQNKKYSGNSFQWIISLLYTLKGIGFEPVPIDDFLVIIIASIRKGESIDTLQAPAISENSPCFQEYKDCIKRLKEIVMDASKSKTADDINAIFEMDKGWGEAFDKYCNENRSEILSAKEFFRKVDIEKCICRVRESPVKEISDFRRGLASIYNFSNLSEFFAADGENFFNFKQKLLSEKFDGKAKIFNIDLLIKNTTDILTNLGYEQTQECIEE